MSAPVTFHLLETTIDAMHHADQSGQLTARHLVQMYIDRIAAYDQTGPTMNAIITLNAHALDAADRLDVAYRSSGCVGPLHGILVVVDNIRQLGHEVLAASPTSGEVMP
jgi:amidase